MGIRALPPSDWLIVDTHRSAELALRRRLLTERTTHVFSAFPHADRASRELARLVNAADSSDHPLVAAASVVQEDLCVLQPVDGRWVLTAAVVCFPSAWHLHEKIGRGLTDIHDPVPGYRDDVASKVDRFLDRLDADRPVWRRNWGVMLGLHLHLPPVAGYGNTPVALEEDGSPLWLRSERQTLRRLPESGAIVFTIRVQVCPIARLLARPDLRRALRATLESWSADVIGYRAGGSGWYAPLLTLLRDAP